MTTALTSVARAWRATAAIAPHYSGGAFGTAPGTRARIDWFQVGLRTAIILGFVLEQDSDLRPWITAPSHVYFP